MHGVAWDERSSVLSLFVVVKGARGGELVEGSKSWVERRRGRCGRFASNAYGVSSLNPRVKHLRNGTDQGGETMDNNGVE